MKLEPVQQRVKLAGTEKLNPVEEQRLKLKHKRYVLCNSNAVALAARPHVRSVKVSEPAASRAHRGTALNAEQCTHLFWKSLPSLL